MSDTATVPTIGLKLLAQTEDSVYRGKRSIPCVKHKAASFVKSAQWTPDGTSIIATTSDNRILTHIIPPDLLEEHDEPLTLQPYSTIISPEAVDATVIYPGFSLEQPETTLVLSATNEHPVRLHSALTSALLASYPLIKKSTETYLKPHCLLFSHNGTRFICGSNSLLSTFDVSRPGQEPISSSPTTVGHHPYSDANPAATMKGIVSALAIDQQYDIMAAGTLTRHIGLYDAGGQGQCIGVFSVQGTAADDAIGGHGVTQVVWSLCGRYLYIAERKSNGIMMYDIRKTGQLLGWLAGRKADTNQRMAIDLHVPDAGNDGHSVRAGGTDGIARAWVSPHHHEGAVLPSYAHLVHSDIVNSTAVHRSGSVLATASGQRHFEDGGECSLKLWALADSDVDTSVER